MNYDDMRTQIDQLDMELKELESETFEKNSVEELGKTQSLRKVLESGIKDLKLKLQDVCTHERKIGVEVLDNGNKKCENVCVDCRKHFSVDKIDTKCKLIITFPPI